ncbi:MAG: carbon-phosphorus lyase complex subunit PhnI, partial [Desulfobacteraceae bacterium]|nr:carbon-phosphorus lyase complex subunit PhnI [Desulfobacteraceae bacterium]
MGYVAVKGGREAIENAERLFHHRRMQQGEEPIGVEPMLHQLHLAVDRVMAEGSLYEPKLAALAMKQSAGDSLEAAFMVRAYRATLPRIGYSVPLSTEGMRVQRRISAAFKNIPGGQILGATPDYTLRLLNFELFSESREDFRRRAESMLGRSVPAGSLPDTFPKVVDLLRQENLLAEQTAGSPLEEPFDVTRQALSFPAPRSAALQSLCRAETGGMLALAYSNMRGYGVVHPTVGELRVGTLDLVVPHPLTREPEKLGEVLVTEAEIIANAEAGNGEPRFSLGYGLS